MFCPSCGEELPEGSKFCRNCGKEMPNVNLDDPVKMPVVEDEHNLAIIAGYILAILIPLFGFIIGIYLYTRKDSQKAQKHAKFVIILAAVVWFISFMTMI